MKDRKVPQEKIGFFEFLRGFMGENGVFSPGELNIFLQSCNIIVRFIFFVFEAHLLSDNVGGHFLIMYLIALVCDNEDQVEPRQYRRRDVEVKL
jgi:hypothetical protein